MIQEKQFNLQLLPYQYLNNLETSIQDFEVGMLDNYYSH